MNLFYNLTAHPKVEQKHKRYSKCHSLSMKKYKKLMTINMTINLYSIKTSTTYSYIRLTTKNRTSCNFMMKYDNSVLIFFSSPVFTKGNYKPKFKAMEG